MFCSKCGTNLQDDAIVCYSCATPISDFTVPQKKSTSRGVVVAVVAAIIVVPILALAFLFGIGSFGWQATVRAGNEAAAAQALDSLRMFQAQYAARNRGTFGSFDQLVGTGIDRQFRGERPVVHGYVFILVVEPRLANKPAFYSISANPQDGAGTRHFYIDSATSGIKATDENRPARADDPSI